MTQKWWNKVVARWLCCLVLPPPLSRCAPWQKMHQRMQRWFVEICDVWLRRVWAIKIVTTRTRTRSAVARHGPPTNEISSRTIWLILKWGRLLFLNLKDSNCSFLFRGGSQPAIVSGPWREPQRRFKSELRSTKHERHIRTIEPNTQKNSCGMWN